MALGEVCGLVASLNHKLLYKNQVSMYNGRFFAIWASSASGKSQRNPKENHAHVCKLEKKERISEFLTVAISDILQVHLPKKKYMFDKLGLSDS